MTKLLKISLKLLASFFLLASFGNLASAKTSSKDNQSSSIDLKASNILSGETLQHMQDDRSLKEKILVIDIRSKKEYKKGHLKFAINLDKKALKTLDKHFITKYKDFPLVLIANKASETKSVLKELKKLGFKDIKIAKGYDEFKGYALYTYTSILGEDVEASVGKKNVLIIDVRAKEDYEKGHLKGAINIPLNDDITPFLPMLEKNKDKKFVVHCYTGTQSQVMSTRLTKLGFKNVYNSLDGSLEYDFKFIH
ncbi:rhodanese-like domain-containing protein [Helicobacter sp. 11S02629-2]|uniref:rhodanese-like domain-containing protein n=1 Tax=Helicobacter sp. 11S02629-2 TaxID=1476195 RepID=UPI0015DAB3B5|nr:rhodanese-like domain-containing protein [Helicobacter sp. 11S02629-2]